MGSRQINRQEKRQLEQETKKGKYFLGRRNKDKGWKKCERRKRKIVQTKIDKEKE